MKANLKNIMSRAWQIKHNFETLHEEKADFGCCLSIAWSEANSETMRTLLVYNAIVEFDFLKSDGTIRHAYGTLKAEIVPETKGTGRKPNESLQTYYDVEKQEWRCFKKANLLKICKRSTPYVMQ